jgi:hypothetical protein
LAGSGKNWLPLSFRKAEDGTRELTATAVSFQELCVHPASGIGILEIVEKCALINYK